ncbi:pentatricopeptide repeat-containing protein At1g80550, mitochondrial-like [Coffea eugenioides]|uniref:pentatricopeptide repeat-containing protein At1g80550, mitochondrial-like n=1 Tax=Coffea eugenioides TaxID=49369 RepID=UPI000F60FDB0|nr:pentatricopeptide repeat-containing protein At1g80550, mitochondrial-like [Coffea eugenioides]
MEIGGRPCKPNAIVHNTIIDRLCKDKLVDQALALLEEMIEKGIYPSARNLIIMSKRKCLRAKGQTFTGRMVRTNLEFPPTTDPAQIWGWELLVLELQCGGKLAARKLEKNGLEIDALKLETLKLSAVTCGFLVEDADFRLVSTWFFVVDALCKEGHIEDAEEVVRTMIQQGVIWCRKELLKGGHYADAIVYHEEMVCRGFLLDSSTFSILLDLSAGKQDTPSLLMSMLKIDPDSKKFQDGGYRGTSH